MLSVIIPTYCEAENIEPLIDRLAAVRGRCGEPFEVLVVDDGSPDQTARLARKRLKRWDLGRVIEGGSRRGLAGAVGEGARQAKGDLVAVMDADLSHPPELLPTLLAAVRAGSEVAVASRYVRGGRIANWSRSRRLLSRLGNLMARPLVPVADATSGYFLTTTGRLTSLTGHRRGFKVLLDVLVRSGVQAVQEVPYEFVDRARGTSKLSRRVLGLYVTQLGRLSLYRWRHRRPQGQARKTTGLNGEQRQGCTLNVVSLVEQKNRETSSEARALRQRQPNVAGWRLAYRLLMRPVLRFWRAYVFHRGWREGLQGLVVGALSAWFEFLTWAKWWEGRLGEPARSSQVPVPAQKAEGSQRGPGAVPPSGRARLSVVVLTKNEEDKIARCLRSVQWADEIIVVDGESEDRTPEICESFGATVVSHAFDGSFATDRNLGLEHAHGEWVLQIDADDVVTPEFRTAVEEMLRADTSLDAFRFRRRSVLLGRVMRYGGWYYSVPNLVRRDRVRYSGVVHERPNIQGTIGELAADVEHHPCQDLATFVTRHNRYTSLQVEELFRTVGVLPRQRLQHFFWRKPWKTFWKSYVKKAGYREGFHGLIFAEFFAGVELMKWAKYWEQWERRSHSPSSS